MFKEYSKDDYYFTDKDGVTYVSTPEYNLSFEFCVIMFLGSSVSFLLAGVLSFFF